MVEERQIIQAGERLAVIFPGQGSQSTGLGKKLLSMYPPGRKKLQTFSSLVDRDLEDLLCGDAVLSDTLSVHHAMVSFGIIAFEWLTTIKKVKPVMLAGHSLGEITALACAGAIPDTDAFLLADARGRFIAEACLENPGGMVAFTGAPIADMQDKINSWIESEDLLEKVWIVNINGPRQLVVAGATESLENLNNAMHMGGTTGIVLVTAGAFHTPFMRSAAHKMSDYLQTLTFDPMHIPVASSKTGRLLTNSDELRTHLALQIVRPVKWLSVMDLMRSAQINSLIEVGPDSGVLSKLAGGFKEWTVKTTQVMDLVSK